jgi:hypothetical protein
MLFEFAGKKAPSPKFQDPSSKKIRQGGFLGTWDLGLGTWDLFIADSSSLSIAAFGAVLCIFLYLNGGFSTKEKGRG